MSDMYNGVSYDEILKRMRGTHTLRIHGDLECSTVNGPGKRAVVWLQGCTLACPGCWNPQTHPKSGGEEVHTVDVAAWVCSMIEGNQLDGLTISGGEPMQQNVEVVRLINTVRALYPELSIGMFTGYTESELDTGCLPDIITTHSWNQGVWAYMRTVLDFAVLGRYNQHKAVTDRPLVTSSNQQLRLYSKRHQLSEFGPLSVEVTIGGGLTQITGFPVNGDILKP